MLLAIVLVFLACCGPSEQPNLERERLRAQNALKMNVPHWARFYFKRALKFEPNDKGTRLGYARAHLSGQGGSLVEAATHLENLLAEPAPNQDAAWLLANLLIDMRQFNRAIDILESFPPSPKRAWLLSRAWLTGDPAQALTFAQKAIEGGKTEAWTVAAKAHRALNQPRDMFEAASNAYTQRPLLPENAFLLASAHRLLGREEEYETYWEAFEFLQRLPGEGYLASIPELEALRILDQHPAFAGNNHRDILLNRAKLCASLGRKKEAVAHINSALALAKETGSGWQNIAITARDLGFPRLANQAWRGMLVQDENARLALLGLSIHAVSTSDLVEAESLLGRGLAIFPEDAQFLFHRGNVLIAKGHHTQAQQMFQKAVYLAPWSTNFRLTYARLLVESGDETTMRELVRETEDRNPKWLAFIERHGFSK